MRPTVEELKAFYATPQGRSAARALTRRIAPAVRRDGRSRLLALGYCAPILRGFSPRWVERLAVVMPFAQGGHRFPSAGSTCACLAEETALPFAEAMFDQAILCHALEFTEPPEQLLRELWRVLAPEGEIVVVVPNRLGVWTHFEAAPFGNGRPFGRRQLERLARSALFEPVSWTTALAAPPLRGLSWLNGPMLRVAPRLGGVHVLLARKRVGPAPVLADAAKAASPAFGIAARARAAPGVAHSVGRAAAEPELRTELGAGC